VLTHAVGLSCVLAATVFAAAMTRRWQDIGLLATGFVVAAVWLQPEPGLTGALVASVAASRLVRPGWRSVGVAAAGLLAGLWAAWLHREGWPLAPALVMSAVIPGLSAWLSVRRTSFAPLRVTEEALFAVCAVGLLVAAGPVVTTGWGSATTLTAPTGVPASGQTPTWLYVAGVGAMTLGGVHSLWRRR
jgi:hypothetical protein